MSSELLVLPVWLVSSLVTSGNTWFPGEKGVALRGQVTEGQRAQGAVVCDRVSHAEPGGPSRPRPASTPPPSLWLPPSGATHPSPCAELGGATCC